MHFQLTTVRTNCFSVPFTCVSVGKDETMRNTWNLIAFISVLYITMMLIYLQKI